MSSSDAETSSMERKSRPTGGVYPQGTELRKSSAGAELSAEVGGHALDDGPDGLLGLLVGERAVGSPEVHREGQRLLPLRDRRSSVDVEQRDLAGQPARRVDDGVPVGAR